MWEVEYTDEFEDWWMSLTQAQQEALDDRVMLLAERGPHLGRPVVGKLRVLFAFDPRRHAILLLGPTTGTTPTWRN